MYSDDDEIKSLAKKYDISINEIESCISQLITIDIIRAGLKLGIDLDNIEDEYRGYFDSDVDFAKEFAESVMELSTEWPYYCIDWEQAATNLMYDYIECGGYYFNNSY